MSQGRHKFIELDENDTVLISAKPIPGNETAVSRNVILNLIRRGAKVVARSQLGHVHVSFDMPPVRSCSLSSISYRQGLRAGTRECRHLSAHADLARTMGVDHVDVLRTATGS